MVHQGGLAPTQDGVDLPEGKEIKKDEIDLPEGKEIMMERAI